MTEWLGFLMSTACVWLLLCTGTPIMFALGQEAADHIRKWGKK